MSPQGYPAKRPSKRELQSLIKSGKPRSSLERRYGVKWTTIRRWMKQLDIALPGKSRLSTAQMRDLYLRQGQTLMQIAERAGLTEGGVGQRLKANGVKLRTPQERLSNAEKDAPFIAAEVTPLEAFTGNNDPRLCRCNRCGNTVAPSRSNLTNGQGGCKYCARRAVTPDSVDDLFTRAGLEPLEPYRSSGAPRLCRCVTCGNKVRPRHNGLQSGHGGCEYCAGVAPKNLKKKDLERLYVQENLSVYAVGERLGCSGTLVLKYLRQHGIPISKMYEKWGATRPTDEELREWYVFERKSSKEIAAECNTTHGVVMRWMRGADIPVPPGGQHRGYYRDAVFLRDQNLYWTDGVVYLVRFSPRDSRSFLKVGIGLHHSMRIRMHELAGAKVVQLRHGPIYDCYVIEQQVIADFAEYRYYPPEGILVSGGRTECFIATARIDLNAYELTELPSRRTA